MADELHVIPRSDLIGHTADDDCPCGPTPEQVEREDGSYGWLMVHHSLDGREWQERIAAVSDEHVKEIVRRSMDSGPTGGTSGGPADGDS